MVEPTSSHEILLRLDYPWLSHIFCRLDLLFNHNRRDTFWGASCALQPIPFSPIMKDPTQAPPTIEDQPTSIPVAAAHQSLLSTGRRHPARAQPWQSLLRRTRSSVPAWGATTLLLLLALPPGVAPFARAQVSQPDGSVRFLAFGDWGRDGQDFQQPVAAQMGRVAAAEHCQFIIALGDNFYNDGVSSVESRQWQTSFEDIYTAPSLQVPWYVALGNHDYHTNVMAQVNYTLHSPRWKMPARYYTFIRRVDDSTTAQFFILDSTPYVAQVGAGQSAPHGDAAVQDTAAQTAWLEAVLRRSTAQWKIVCAHHPVYSSGKHGDTSALVARIEPLLEEYGVQVYLNGHEHDMEHLRVGRINYFTSGAGSKTRPATHDTRTLFSLGDTGGFLYVKITPDDFSASFIDYTGKVVYTTRFTRAETPAPLQAR